MTSTDISYILVIKVEKVIPRKKVKKINKETEAIYLRNIRRMIDEKGIKHCKVAEKLGIRKEEFSRMLSGTRVIRVYHLPIIADALGCSLDDLFKEDGAV